MKRLALMASCAALLLPASALAKDYASTALNIVPSGQYGDVPIPPGADGQAKMYDGLTPLFGSVTTADLFKYFKSERLGTKGQGKLRVERPRKGVTIVRDRFDVPHITAKTHDLLTWATGYVAGEDRHLLIDQARGDARIAALDVPGLDAFGLVKGLKTFVPSAQTEAIVARQTKALQHAGANGREVLHNTDLYAQGVNAWYKHNGTPANPPFGRNDVYAVNALAGQLFGRGGGNEVQSSMLLSALDQRLGASQGTLLWNDLRERTDPEAVVTADGSFPYDPTPKHARPRQRDHRQRQFRAGPGPGGHHRAHGGAREQLPDGRRQALHQPPPAVRRGSADRLLLPRPDPRGGPQGAGHRVPRRQRPGLPGHDADRPRPRLLVEPHVRRLRRDRRLRGDALRR